MPVVENALARAVRERALRPVADAAAARRSAVLHLGVIAFSRRRWASGNASAMPPCVRPHARTLALDAFSAASSFNVVVGRSGRSAPASSRARPLQRAHAVIGTTRFGLAIVHGIMMVTLGIAG